MIWTGIGSRQAPESMLEFARWCGYQINTKGDKLRSGGAKGMDTAFEIGFRSHGKYNGVLEIYRQKHHFINEGKMFYNPDMLVRATALAESTHPAWHACNQYARDLLGRNPFQLLGPSLNDSSDVILCWTIDGSDVGGTGNNIRLAKLRGIKMLNFWNEVDRDEAYNLLK